MARNPPHQPGEVQKHTYTVFDVTTASQEVLAANPDRQGVLLINLSDQTIYVKVGAVAVDVEGIRLNANGGNYTMNKQNKNLSLKAINSIHGGSGNKVLSILELEIE